CPGYASASVSSSQACGNQLYSFRVENNNCPGTINFNVVGHYGSQWANEITWQVVSIQSGAVVASGGPGTNNGTFNVSVGPLDPNIHGNVFRLIIFDAFGDGFNGTGGFIEVRQGATVVA